MSDRTRREDRVRTWGLFLLLFLSAAYFHHPVEYDNTLSRHFLLSSLVDFRRLDIDAYKGETIDIAFHGGHAYSNKAIGLPLMAAPVYWLLRRWSPLGREGPLSPLVLYLCRLAVVTLPFALLGAAMFRLLLAMGASARSAYDAVLAYSFGTVAWIHATLFSGHQTAAALAFFSYACLRGAAGRDAGAARVVWAGFLAGMAVLCDQTAAILAALLALYAWEASRDPGRRAAFAAGALLPACALLAYNMLCFGGPLSFAYSHLDVGLFGVLSRQGPLGVGVGLPDLRALAALLGSPSRGLFFIMPVLLLSLAGFRAAPFPRRDRLLIAGSVSGYLIVNAGYFAWHGGWSFGPRYLVPILPFLALPLGFVARSPWFLPLFFLSFVQVGLAQAVMPHTPEVFRNPVLECLIPLLRYGYRSMNWGMGLGLSGAYSLIPLCGLAAWAWRMRPPASSAVRRGPRGGWLFGSACGVVVLAVACVRSPAARAHAFNAHLLRKAAHVMGSPGLERAAESEERLSRAE